MVASPEQIHERLLAQQSPRALRLDRLERYVEGTQYEGRPDFLTADVPLTERAPAIVYPLVPSAIQSNVDFVLGEGRWPTLTSFTSEDDSAFDDRFGLSEDDSDALDKFIAKLIEQSHLKAAFRELLEQAQGCGTAVPIVGIRQGRIEVTTVRAKWCAPTFGPSGEVIKLVVQYPYIEDYQDEAFKWQRRVMAYRREIDADADTTFEPVEVVDRTPPVFGKIAERVEHKLKFCPVLWYRFMRPCSTVSEVDGRAIHGHLLEELDALNLSLSQKFRAALYAGDPLYWETGVEPDHNPAPMGRRSMVIMGGDGSPAWLTDRGDVKPSGGPARKKGPGIVWRYTNSESKVGALTLPGDALDAIDKHCVDLRAKLTEALGVVFIDPEKLPSGQGAMSGKALRMLYGRQVARCDLIRDDFGNNCILPLVDMILRAIMARGRDASGSLWIAGIKKALPILRRFEQPVGDDVATATAAWFAPRLSLVWPDYFKPNAQDELWQVQTATQALAAKVITRKMAVESLREIFEFESAEEVLKEIDEDAADAQAKALDQAKAMAALAPKQDQQPAQPPPAKPQQQPNGARSQ